MAYSPLPLKPPATAPIADRLSSGMVGRAAAILAREASKVPVASVIAAGMNEQALPATSIEELHQRAMALLSDLFSYLGAQVPGADSLVRSALEIPWRRPAAPAFAGGSTSIPLRLENLEDRPVTLSFYSSDLLSDGGGSIPSFAVSFDPATLDVGAGAQAVITAKIEVPAQATPGAYSGLVQAAGLERVKAVITVDIC